MKENGKKTKEEKSVRRHEEERIGQEMKFSRKQTQYIFGYD